MQNIYVTFPPKGPPTVNPEDEAVIAGHQISWHIENFNPAVAGVKIEFEAPEGASPLVYFPTFGEEPDKVVAKSKSLKKGLDPRASSTAPPCWVATIWGEAPSPGKGRTRRDKYWVKGIGANGNALEEFSVDPKIVTSDP